MKQLTRFDGVEQFAETAVDQVTWEILRLTDESGLGIVTDEEIIAIDESLGLDQRPRWRNKRFDLQREQLEARILDEKEQTVIAATLVGAASLYLIDPDGCISLATRMHDEAEKRDPNLTLQDASLNLAHFAYGRASNVTAKLIQKTTELTVGESYDINLNAYLLSGDKRFFEGALAAVAQRPIIAGQLLRATLHRDAAHDASRVLAAATRDNVSYLNSMVTLAEEGVIEVSEKEIYKLDQQTRLNRAARRTGIRRSNIGDVGFNIDYLLKDMFKEYRRDLRLYRAHELHHDTQERMEELTNRVINLDHGFPLPRGLRVHAKSALRFTRLNTGLGISEEASADICAMGAHELQGSIDDIWNDESNPTLHKELIYGLIRNDRLDEAQALLPTYRPLERIPAAFELLLRRVATQDEASPDFIEAVHNTPEVYLDSLYDVAEGVVDRLTHAHPTEEHYEDFVLASEIWIEAAHSNGIDRPDSRELLQRVKDADIGDERRAAVLGLLIKMTEDSLPVTD